MLPSTAGFVDPLLSTGFPLALLGIGRLAELIANNWGSACFPDRLQTYAASTEGELLAAARLVAALYFNMSRFPVFVSLSMLYFAAASFSETARRLNKAHLAPSFLLHDDALFGPASRQLLKSAQCVLTPREAEQLQQRIAQAIEPFNIAGLANDSLRNWYPVDAGDLFRSAEKVGAAQEEISALLERSGF